MAKRGKRVVHKIEHGSLTQKHFAEGTDINRMMERHRAGAPLQGAGRPSGDVLYFGSLTGASYHEMLVRLQNVQGAFSNFPAKTRKFFGNNPENMLTFLEDEKNMAKALELGIVDRESLSEEKIQQLDLARQADEQDKREFLEWQRKKRATENSDPFEREEATGMPTSDEEAQPRFSKKKRT